MGIKLSSLRDTGTENEISKYFESKSSTIESSPQVGSKMISQDCPVCGMHFKGNDLQFAFHIERCLDKPKKRKLESNSVAGSLERRTGPMTKTQALPNKTLSVCPICDVLLKGNELQMSSHVEKCLKKNSKQSKATQSCLVDFLFKDASS